MNNRNTIDVGSVIINEWKLNITWISRDEDPRQLDYVRIEKLLYECELCFDPDYTYDKDGFVIWHRGRRGNMLSIWHSGYWGDTKEIFFYSIYWKHESPELIEILSNKDPIMSHFDIDVVISILNKFRPV